VSTVIPAFIPKAFPSNTLAVFLPTPGSVVNSSIVNGNSPLKRLMICSEQAMMFFAFAL
jgi:hypothetical protein